MQVLIYNNKMMKHETKKRKYLLYDQQYFDTPLKEPLKSLLTWDNFYVTASFQKSQET